MNTDNNFPEPKRIDIKEWSLKGEGLFGNVYESDKHPGVILKLNKNTDKEGPWEEYDKSGRILALGVKTPRVYDFVTDGQHFGYTAQKIVGKKSFSRLVADNPKETDHYARLYSQEAIAFHNTPCDTSAFPSMHKEMADAIAGSKLLSDKVKQDALAILADIPDTCTCLHGDFTTGNLITDGKECYWIDLGWFSYGNPLFDLTQFYFYQKYLPTLFLKKVIHLSHRQIKAFSISLCKHYFQLHEPEEKKSMEPLMRKVMYIRVLKMAIEKNNRIAALVLIPIAQKEGGFKTTSRLTLLYRAISGKPLI